MFMMKVQNLIFDTMNRIEIDYVLSNYSKHAEIFVKFFHLENIIADAARSTPKAYREKNIAGIKKIIFSEKKGKI